MKLQTYTYVITWYDNVQFKLKIERHNLIRSYMTGSNNTISSFLLLSSWIYTQKENQILIDSPLRTLTSKRQILWCSNIGRSNNKFQIGSMFLLVKHASMASPMVKKTLPSIFFKKLASLNLCITCHLGLASANCKTNININWFMLCIFNNVIC